MAFILAADECIVVTTPEPTSITDAYSIIKHIVLKEMTKPMYVVMNRTQEKREGKQMLDKFQQLVQQFLKKDLTCLGAIPNDRVVQKAVIAQTPYVLYDERAAVSKAIKSIAANYLQEGKVEWKEEEQLSFVQRLQRLLKKR